MNRGPTGEWTTTSVVGDQPVRAFIPRPLPPHPPIQIEGSLRAALDEALLALGRLDSVTTLLPDTALFLYTYVRQEAVLSSQIEGTRSTLSDLLLFELDEAPGVPLGDVQEVSSYVEALEYGLRRVREGFPLSNRLLREIHGILLSKGRGAERQPGEFRRAQNWIGGTRPGNATYVPPPWQRVEECMADLERFLHDQPGRTPTLLKAAFAHAQFESIHPFLDGNGRVGRLLITLLLCCEGVLGEPLLYLSLYLRARRDEYFDLLQRTRLEGDWEAWLEFFAEGVRETAKAAVATARRLVDLFGKDRDRILAGLRRSAGSALRVHHVLQGRPVITIARAVQDTKLTIPTVTAALNSLQRLGIVREITGRRRNRVYAYDRYVAMLTEGTGIS